MDLLKMLGFLCLGIGGGILIGYGIYGLIRAILGEVPLLVKIPLVLVILGFVFLIGTAVRDRLKEEKIEGI